MAERISVVLGNGIYGFEAIQLDRERSQSIYTDHNHLFSLISEGACKLGTRVASRGAEASLD